MVAWNHMTSHFPDAEAGRCTSDATSYVPVCCESVPRRVEVSRFLAFITDGGKTRTERLRLLT
jgi:hypothetical protein